MSRSTKYTVELLSPIVRASKSIAEVMRKLNIRWSGGQQQHIKQMIARYALDTSHFLGQRINIGGTFSKRRPAAEILVLSENTRREKTNILKRALIEVGCAYVCAECSLGDTWRGLKITLQINHKNGNWSDNRQNNLEFLCPNCHSQTEGWSGRK